MKEQDIKIREWILEEQIKAGIIGLIREGLEVDLAMEIAVRVMKKVIGDAGGQVSGND